MFIIVYIFTFIGNGPMINSLGIIVINYNFKNNFTKNLVTWRDIAKM